MTAYVPLGASYACASPRPSTSVAPLVRVKAGPLHTRRCVPGKGDQGGTTGLGVRVAGANAFSRAVPIRFASGLWGSVGAGYAPRAPVDPCRVPVWLLPDLPCPTKIGHPNYFLKGIFKRFFGFGLLEPKINEFVARKRSKTWHENTTISQCIGKFFRTRNSAFP